MYITKVINKFARKQDTYEPFKRPPDLILAQNHGIASRFAQISNEKAKVCPCCGVPIANEQLEMCCDRQDMGFNGAGVPLFFEFLIFCMIILIILSLASGIYNTIANYLGNECLHREIVCQYNFFNRYSLANRNKESDIALYILDLLATIAIIGATIYYRRWMNLTAAEIDNSLITISDFSIQVSNLPQDATQEEILKFFSEIDRNGVRIKLAALKVNLGYNLIAYMDLANSKLRKELQLTNMLQNHKSTPNETQKQQLQEEINKIQEMQNEYEKDFEGKCTFSGVAFITYNTYQQAKLVRQYYNLSKVQLMFLKLWRCCQSEPIKEFRGRIPLVMRAPEPGDVLWQNIGTDPWVQVKFQLLTDLASLFLIGLCFGAILGISKGQDSLNNEASQTTGAVSGAITILGLVASLVISALNSFMGIVMKRLVAVEKPATQTEFNISYAQKLGVAQFINTAVVPLLVNLLLISATDSIDNVWKRGGLNSDVMLILLINAAFPWLYSIFNPFHFWKLYKRQKAMDQDKECPLTQREANLLYEGLVGDLSEKYATVTKTIMVTFFYAQLLPLGIYLALAFCLIYYWVEKYCFLHRYTRGPSIGAQLAQDMVDRYIELSLVLFASGNCIWQKVIVGEIHIVVWIQLGICLFQYFLPIDWIFDWLLAAEEAEAITTYENSKRFLWDDYEKRNPATMQKGIAQWMAGGQGSTQEQGRMMQLLDKIRLQNQEQMFQAQHRIIKTMHYDNVNVKHLAAFNQVNPVNSSGLEQRAYNVINQQEEITHLAQSQYRPEPSKNTGSQTYINQQQQQQQYSQQQQQQQQFGYQQQNQQQPYYQPLQQNYQQYQQQHPQFSQYQPYPQQPQLQHPIQNQYLPQFNQQQPQYQQQPPQGIPQQFYYANGQQQPSMPQQMFQGMPQQQEEKTIKRADSFTYD